MTGMEVIPPSRMEGTIVAPHVSPHEASQGLQALQASGVNIDKVERFDWREKDYELDKVLMQGTCGNCWAMSSTSALCDRFIIAKNLNGLHLNPLVLTVCEKVDQGCGGGHPGYAGLYFESHGTAEADPSDHDCPTWEEEWNKFKQQHGGKPPAMSNSYLPSCPQLGGCPHTYRALQGSTRSCIVLHDSKTGRSLSRAEQIEATIKFIKTELYTKGPVVGGYVVYADFPGGTGLKGTKAYDYKWGNTGGIYINGMYDQDLERIYGGRTPSIESESKKRGGWNGWGKTKIGGHAVVIVGWDHEEVLVDGKKQDVEYWIVKNSWSDRWNDDGYFKYAITKHPNGFNSRCGLDVGVMLGNGRLLFGATKFDADTRSGHPSGHPFHKKNGGSKDSSSHGWKFTTMWIIVISVLLVGLGIWFWRRSRRSLQFTPARSHPQSYPESSTGMLI